MWFSTEPGVKRVVCRTTCMVSSVGDVTVKQRALHQTWTRLFAVNMPTNLAWSTGSLSLLSSERRWARYNKIGQKTVTQRDSFSRDDNIMPHGKKHSKLPCSEPSTHVHTLLRNLTFPEILLCLESSAGCPWLQRHGQLAQGAHILDPEYPLLKDQLSRVSPILSLVRIFRLPVMKFFFSFFNSRA